MEENQELEVIQTAGALEEITKAEIDVQISTAKKFPRSIKQFLDKATSLATINEDVAASCCYSLPRGGKTIEGESVRLAEIVCSSYGNIRAGARVIANDGKTITAQGICHDLENNTFISKEVKRRITDKYGRTYNEDMQVVVGNAACSIAFRNAVFSVVPKALTQEVFKSAKEVARGTEKTLPKRRDAAVKYFVDKGIKKDDICKVLGIKRIEDIDLDLMTTLRGMVTLAETGEMSIKSIFDQKIADIDDATKEKLNDRIKAIKEEK